MRDNLIFKFIITYFFNVTCFTLLSFLIWSKINFEITFLLSFIVSFLYLLHQVDKKFSQGDELTKNNYWQLKNELKRRVNGKEKKDSGKQVL